MPRSARSDIGLVAVTLAGFYLLYEAVSGLLLAFTQLTYLTHQGEAPGVATSFLILLGPTISLAAVGLYLVLGRHSVAHGLFGEAQCEEEDEDRRDLLLACVTCVGIMFLVFGLQSLAHLVTEWIGGNLQHDPLMPLPEKRPIEVWPYRVGAVVELACGYFLVFRARSITVFLRARAR